MRKYTLFLFIVIISLFSGCSYIAEKGVIDDTKQITSEYIDTLSGTIENTHSVIDTINKQNSSIEDNIKATFQ